MPNVTGLVVAIAETFTMDVPAGAHEGVVVPLGTILCAFSCKMVLPNLFVLHEKFRDGGGIVDYTLLCNFDGLPLIILLLSIIPWRGGEFGRWLFWSWLDEIGGKDHVEGANEHRLKNFVKTNEAVIDHQVVGMFLTFSQPTLGVDFHGVQELCGKLAIGSYARFEDYFLGLDGHGDGFYSNDERTARTK
jgi:hypothetical protein